MNAQAKHRPSFWKTVGLLLASSRKRSEGRIKRQRELLNSRSKGKGTDWAGLGFGFFVLFMIFIHGAAAVCVSLAVEAAQRVEVERQGKFVVSPDFLEGLRNSPDEEVSDTNQYSGFAYQAKHISEKYGGAAPDIERKLRETNLFEVAPVSNNLVLAYLGQNVLGMPRSY